MSMRLRFKSLRTRLTFWFLVVTMLSLMAVVTIVYFQRADALRSQEFEKLQMVRDLKVVKLSGWIDERVGDLKVASDDDEIQTMEGCLLESGAEMGSATVLKARNLLQRYVDYYDAYSEFFIVSASSGEVMISTDSTHEGLDKKTDLYFTEPMRTGNTYIKDIYYSETERAPAMTFSTPIFCLEHEGELGRAIATQSISWVRDIPADTLFTFKTTCGTAIPKEILTIPLLVGRNVMGVISLATLNTYSDIHREILDQAQLGMNTAFSDLLAGVKTQHLAEELGASNRELQAQARELEQQAVELEAQHQQVQDANRLKSEFLSNMSHELRTPLNSVLSLSQLMLENEMDIDGGENREHIEIIERNGRQLLNLINSILDLSKIEAGKMELYISSFPIAEIVNSVGASMRPLMDAKGLSFKMDVAEMAEMQSDKEKLQQVLFNLLSNAQKFTETGEIRIQVRSIGETLVFTVQDTGCGISKDELPHIFDEFRQLDGSTTRQHGGTGLGLAISQRLVALLGGEIDVHSELGKGTTVTLTLPRMIEGDVNESKTGLPMELKDIQRWTPGAEPPRILVVEDNQVGRLQITRMLEASGFVVDTAKNGEEGLAQAQEHLPDGILLDLMMPKVDGFQMLEAIRSTPETEKIPVLVLTAKEVTAAERANLSYNNVRQLIQKGSLNRANLIHAVRQLIGMQEQQFSLWSKTA